MIQEIREHLLHKIIPFWESLRDDENGGYYGYVDHDLHVDEKAFKGCILNNRITWFFSSAAKLFLDERAGKVSSVNPPVSEEFIEELLDNAKHGFAFLKSACLDPVHGGMYWSVSYDGKPYDTTKHTYNQAFSIYALCSYYDVTRNEEDLEIAEVFGCGGKAASVAPERQALVFELRERMDEIFTIFTEKMYNPEKHRMEVFFDHEYIPLIDLVSYGHDIETSWLIDRGCDVIRLVDAENGTISSEDYVLLKKMEKIARDLSAAIYRTGFDGHSLPEECENGIVKTSRTWWMQAETLVGFLNAYQHDMSRSEYLEAVRSVWDYICEYQVDHREGSEWFHDLYEDGTPFEHQPIVEQWKCPYHNGRMCIEVIRRGVR